MLRYYRQVILKCEWLSLRLGVKSSNQVHAESLLKLR